MGAAVSGSDFFQGAVMSAISGVEMALWDLAGQAAGAPICDGELLVPDRPGLGIRLDDGVVRRHLREEHGFFPQARRHGTS